jgi:hypothetical protein
MDVVPRRLLAAAAVEMHDARGSPALTAFAGGGVLRSFRLRAGMHREIRLPCKLACREPCSRPICKWIQASGIDAGIRILERKKHEDSVVVVHHHLRHRPACRDRYIEADLLRIAGRCLPE